jgi:NADH dehydrogenase FAD-containing subunit
MVANQRIPRTVLLGGGFGKLRVGRALRHSPAEIHSRSPL